MENDVIERMRNVRSIYVNDQGVKKFGYKGQDLEDFVRLWLLWQLDYEQFQKRYC